MLKHLHGIGASVLLLASAGLAWYGQPSYSEKWYFMAPELEPRLVNREVQIDPLELMHLMHDDYIDLRLIDVRDESDWNLFHLWGAQRVPHTQLGGLRESFATLPENGVIVLVSNDEAEATQAWKLVMAAANKPNAYILAGGINRWLREFAVDESDKQSDNILRKVHVDQPDGTLRHPLKWALGSRHPASLPDPHNFETHQYTKKVKLQKRVVKKGGCG
jgi:rhodanese-related sulfurtransferase